MNLGYPGWALVMYVVELEERGFEGVPCAKKVWIRKKKVRDKISCSDSRDGRTMYFILLLFFFLFFLQLEWMYSFFSFRKRSFLST